MLHPPSKVQIVRTCPVQVQLQEYLIKEKTLQIFETSGVSRRVEW